MSDRRATHRYPPSCDVNTEMIQDMWNAIIAIQTEMGTRDHPNDLTQQRADTIMRNLDIILGLFQQRAGQRDGRHGETKLQ